MRPQSRGTGVISRYPGYGLQKACELVLHERLSHGRNLGGTAEVLFHSFVPELG